MNNVLLYIGGLLVMILAALFAVPYFIDWNGYRGVFEEEASKVLGRDVRVGGAVNLRLLPTPYVRFEKVRLADTSGQTGEPFIRADSFTMWLSGPPLLRGVLEANQVELNRPVLSLVLDGQGGGNWSNFKIKPGALPFVPQDVALRSVKLQDGKVALYDAQSQPLGRLDAINGELSADALAGPYKFKGLAKWTGEEREIKFATTPPDAEGGFAFKANIRTTKSNANYAIDGRVENGASKPKLTGDLTALVQFPDAAPVEPKAAENQPKAAHTEIAGTEIKAHVTADALGAKFDDINIALDSAAEPQIITGSAQAAWAGTPRLDMVLAAKWLDLDRLAGAGEGEGEGGASLPKIRSLGLGLLHALAGDGAAGTKIDIEQIKIGGETAGGLKIDADRQNGAVHLKELRAGLPGGSRLDLSGDMTDDNGVMSFDGSMLVHGSSLGRLLAWAAKSGSPIDVKADGPFSAEGRLLSTGKMFGFTDAKAEISGQSLTGEYRVVDDGRHHTSIIVEGARIDTAQLFPTKAREIETEIRRALGLAAPLAPAAETDQVGAAKPAQGDSPAKAGDAAKSDNDVSLRVLAGELKSGVRTYRNVDATLVLEGGEFRVPNAKFNTESGLGVTFEAKVKNAANEPKGNLAYEFDAQTPAALKDAAILTGLSEFLPAERFAALGNARVAGLVRLGDRGKGFADLSFGGEVKGAQVSGQAQLDGGIAGWRSQPSRVTINVSAASLEPIQLALNGQALPGNSGKPRPAVVTIASSGIFGSGAAAHAEIKSEGLEAVYAGNVVWSEASPFAFDGNLKLKARNMAEAFGLAGIVLPAGSAGTPVDGAIDIAAASGKYDLVSRKIRVGETTVQGRIKLERKAGAINTLAADLVADRVKVSGLMSGILDRRAGSARGTEDAGDGDDRQGIWPEAPFNFDSVKSLQGSVNVKFASLELTEGLTAHDGTMKLEISPNKVSISELTGRAAGGKLHFASDFEKAAEGVAMSSHLKIDGAELAALSRTAKGRASIELTGSARAASPAGLIAVLSGKGNATLDDASHPGPALINFSQTSDAVLNGKLPNDAGAISETLLASLANSRTAPGSRTIPLAIGDGTVKLDSYVIEGTNGKATVTTTIAIASLALDSLWQIAALAPPQQPPPGAGPDWTATVKGPLPIVPVVYTGRLADLGNLDVKVETSELQRELTSRQMERSVEELERLRRKEEERVKREQERRKAIEAERAAALAAAAAAKAQAAMPVAPPVVPVPVAPQVVPVPVTPPAGQQQQPPVRQPAVQQQPLPPVLPESNGADAAASDPQGNAPANAAKYHTEAGASEPVPSQSVSPPAAVEGSRAVPIEITPDGAVAGQQSRPPAAARPPAASSYKPPAGRSQRSPRNAAEEMSRAIGGAP